MMNTTSFFFYDYETFGKDPKKDKIAQFAGIRTDMDFNLIGEPIVLFCKPSKDFLPSAEACLVTGITPQVAEAQGIPEFEFMSIIKDELGKKGTCHVGYNNIQFDDEFSRFGFYKNFIDPYSHEYWDQNSRIDLLDIVRMTYALRPEGINWPKNEEEQVNLKLENLSIANGIEHSNAHDALADVWATIKIAQKIQQANPKLFTYALSLRNKKETQNLLENCRNELNPVLNVTSFVPLKNGHLSFFVPLSVDKRNKNAYNGIDLKTSPKELVSLNVEELRAKLYKRTEDQEENEVRPGVRQVVINKSSMFVTTKILNEKRAKEFEIDLKKIERHRLELVDICENAPDFIEKINEVFNTPYPKQEDVDAQLYEKFIDQNDKLLGQRVSSVGKTNPSNLNLKYFPFKDDRLKEMLFRYKGRNFYNDLSEDDLKKFKSYCRAKVFDGIGGELPFDKYMEHLSNLINEMKDEDDLNVLYSLEKYAKLLAKELNS